MSSSSAPQNAQRRRVPVIIDTDPGIDDSMALLLALSPLADDALVELEVLALTIVHGNSNNVELLGRNACHVLDLAGRPDIPVYLGCDKPLIGAKLLGAPHVHGDNAVGDVPIPEPSTKPVPKHQCSAPEFIAKTCRARPGEIVIISLGPMTNLAAALSLDAELPKFVKRVVSMGGVVAMPGNITPLSEANVCNDPHAAHMVFNAGWEVTLAPLNVTHLFTLTFADVQQLGALSKAGKFVHDITQFYLRFYKQFFKRRDFIAVHDSTAIMSVIAPHLFTHCRKVAVSVETQGEFTRGVCVADLRFDSASPREPYTVFLDGRPVPAPVAAPAPEGLDSTLVAQVEQQHADHKEAIATLVSNDKDGAASPTSSNAVASLAAETYIPSDGKVTLLLGIDPDGAKSVLFKKLQQYGF